MKLEYIKANGKCYYPQEAGIQHSNRPNENYPVCLIKELWFGRWQIDYYDEDKWSNSLSARIEDEPNQRLMLYPSGIEEIKWDYHD